MVFIGTTALAFVARADEASPSPGAGSSAAVEADGSVADAGKAVEGVPEAKPDASAATARAAAPAVDPVPAAGSAAQAPKRGKWEVMQKKNGIVAQRREVEGSPLHEFQGTGVIDAPLSLVFAVIRDANRREEWMSDCVGSRMLEERPDTNQISYNRTGTPWPVAHRDIVLQGKVEIDVKKREVRLPFSEIEHPEAPPVSGVVRMPFLRGHWRLVPQGENATLVEYQVHANPGGALPGWVVNWVSQKLPYETLKNLRTQVKKDPYTEVVRRFEAKPEYAKLVGRDVPVAETAAE